MIHNIPQIFALIGAEVNLRAKEYKIENAALMGNAAFQMTFCEKHACMECQV
jgi:hypothetical protein